jgi:hypothetical protein
MQHITRLFPKIRTKLGDKPTLEQIMHSGFDIKLTAEIKSKLMEAKEGDYLLVLTANDPQTGALTGLNLKVTPPRQISKETM